MHSIVEAGERASRFLHVMAVIGLSTLITGALITCTVIALQAVVDLIVSNLPPR